MRLLRFGVDRLPGITTPFGFSADPGLNLLVGPNGIGKSSVARALHFLLWPGRGRPSPDLVVHAEFQVGPDVLRAEFRGFGEVIWSKDGGAVPPPDLPPERLAPCHHLDVLDLLPVMAHPDDLSLTGVLVKELGGGVNLAAVRDDLFPSRGPSPQRRYDDYRAAETAIATITARHRGLADQEASLAELEGRRDDALSAQARHAVLALALRRTGIKAEVAALENELAAIPAAVESVRTEDPENLTRFRGDIRDRRADLAQLDRDLAALAEDVAACGIQADPAPALAPVQQGLKDLRTLAGQVGEANRLRNQARLRISQATAALPGGAMPPGRWDAIDPDSVRTLMHLGCAVLEQQSLVKGLAETAAPQLPGSSSRWARLFLWTGIAAMLCGAAAGLVSAWRPIGLPAAALGLGLLGGAAALRAAARPRASDPDRSAGRLASERARAEEASRKLSDAADRLGLKLDSRDPALALILQAALEFRNARSEADLRDAECRELEERRTAMLEEVNSRLASLGSAACATLEDAEAAAAGILRRWERFQGLMEKKKSLEGRRREFETSIAGREEDLRVLFDRLGLEPDPRNDREVGRYLSLQPRFRAISSTLKSLQATLDGLEREIRQGKDLFRGDDPATPDLETLDPAILTSRLQTEQELAAQASELAAGVGAIGEALRSARRGHDLQAALADRNRAREDLQEILAAQLLNQCGRVMLDRARRDHGQRTRPAALDQADRYLKTFTGGAYGLALLEGENEEATFAAVDLDSNRRLTPAQLSAGTRVQLLLAARLGFLATMGGAIRPPLVIDDALGSSDPVRFRAIVTALGRLCAAGGHQVFHLGPRPGEAEAWRRILEEDGLGVPAVIDLAAIRGKSASAADQVLRTMDLPAHTPPGPGGRSAAEYGALLGVPRADLRAPAESLPLFYLLTDELELLHCLLVAGCGTVGRWTTAQDWLPESGLVDARAAGMVAARIKVWRKFREAWSVGRPPKVDLPFLKNSSAVSGTFLQRVADLLVQVEGSGQGLLDGLRDRQVPGFRVANIDLLAEELDAAGFLDDRPLLDREDLVRTLVEGVAGEVRAGLLDMTAVHRLVDRFLAHE